MRPIESAMRLTAAVLLCAAILLTCVHCGDDDAKNFAPSIESLSCPPDTVPYGIPCVFAWQGADRDGRISGYFHGLNDDTPENWTTAESCTLQSPPLGRNIFYVLAQDEKEKTSEPASCAFVVRESECLVTPSSLDFGSVDVGSDSVLAFTIMNAGSFAVDGEVVESCDDFELISGAGPFSLDGGGSQQVSVRFSPAACGTSRCVVETGNAGCGAVSCAGIGGGAKCEVSPPALDFGAVDIGFHSDLSFVLTNVGCETLSGEVSAPGPEFSIEDGATYSLEPGRSAAFTVRFSPIWCGLYDREIETGHGACAPVPCTGTGRGAACEVRPATLDFGEVPKGMNGDRAFWIVNTGCVAQEGHLRETCPAFAVLSAPSWSLSPGESTEVIVRFSPTSCDETDSCWIETGNPLADSVFCTGRSSCGCWVSDDDMYHNFGCLDADLSSTEAFYIKNLDPQPLTLDIRIKPGCAGGFEITLGGGSQVIAPNEEHQVVVRFSPGEASSYNCILDLGDCGEIKLVGSRCGGDLPVPTADFKCLR